MISVTTYIQIVGAQICCSNVRSNWWLVNIHMAKVSIIALVLDNIAIAEEKHTLRCAVNLVHT